MTLISVIVPVYGGEHTIIDLIKKVDSTLGGRYEWEAILVHDHGSDESWEMITKICDQYSESVSGYKMAANYGQQRALMFGLSMASGDFIVTMDEDLQHDPEDIPKLITRAIVDGYDIVYGRFRKLEQPYLRKVFSRILRFILVSFIPHLTKDYSPFRVIKSTIADKLIGRNGTIVFIDDYLCKITDNISVIDLEHYKRPGGSSSYSVMGLIGLAISAILAYSYIVPLLLISGVLIGLFPAIIKLSLPEETPFVYCGIVFLLIGIAGLIVNMINKRRNNRIVEVTIEYKLQGVD